MRKVIRAYSLDSNIVESIGEIVKEKQAQVGVNISASSVVNQLLFEKLVQDGRLQMKEPSERKS